MLHSLLFLDIGGPEFILILVVGLLLFGGEKLPELARGLGKGIRDFKDAASGVQQEFHESLNQLEEKHIPHTAPVINHEPAESQMVHEPASYKSVHDTEREAEFSHQTPLIKAAGGPTYDPNARHEGTSTN